MSVYYLPGRMSMAAAPLAPEWPSFPTRLRNAWWRFHLALAEVRALLRSRPDPGDAFELPLPAAPAPTRPAQVIDFEAARRRLRPAPRG